MLTYLCGDIGLELQLRTEYSEEAKIVECYHIFGLRKDNASNCRYLILPLETE
uniref:Uncharacterized protein n=1 Tax=Arion vulgaris TaxID=1028688 RepID=A0A0B7AVA3_9EUPU